MKHPYLMTPGPSPLAPRVKSALAKDIIHHRTEEFISILRDINSGIKYVFQTENPVLTFASSGTGAMEAAICNFLSQGDTVLVVCGGKFGERWAELCKEYKIQAKILNVAWGTSPSPEEIGKILKEEKNIKAVYTTLCETSTATVFEIEKIAAVVKQTSAILVVDAISGLGADILKTDAWGVDVVVSGSQKSLMLPPGLGFISLSKKAQELLKTATLPRYYFDLRKALKAYEKDDTPFTPAVNLIVALRESIDSIQTEGIETIWRNFSHIAASLREALKTLGLQIYSQSPSSAVTAALVGEGKSAKVIASKMRKEYGVSIAAGQGEIEDKIIRIAHMGYINPQDVIMCLSILEKVLKDNGLPITLGTSLKRFQEVYYV